MLLTVREVAERLRLHPATVYRLARAGKLPSLRVGRSIRFHADEIERVSREAPSMPDQGAAA